MYQYRTHSSKTRTTVKYKKEGEKRAATKHSSQYKSTKCGSFVDVCVCMQLTVSNRFFLFHSNNKTIISFTTWYFCWCCCNFILKKWSLNLRESDRWLWLYLKDMYVLWRNANCCLYCYCYLSRACGPFFTLLSSFSCFLYLEMHSFHRWLMLLWVFAKQIIRDAIWHVAWECSYCYESVSVCKCLCIVHASVSIYVIILCTFG